MGTISKNVPVLIQIRNDTIKEGCRTKAWHHLITEVICKHLLLIRLILPDATAFLNSLLDSDDQIPISTPAYTSFSSQRRSDSDLHTGLYELFESATIKSRSPHRTMRAFRVSDDQIPISTPDHASFSCQRRSDPDLHTGPCVLFLPAIVRSWSHRWTSHALWLSW